MYITNDPDVARVAEDAGVDRIFVDMEYIFIVQSIGSNDIFIRKMFQILSVFFPRCLPMLVR